MKESFVIYKGFYAPIKELSNDDLGQLFRWIFEYQINGIEPTNTDRVFMAFQFFKNQFRLDDVKYEKVINRNRNNGLKGGRKAIQSNPNNPLGFLEPQKADNEKDNEKVNDIELRKKKFASTLEPFLISYGKELINDFYKYWTEPNKSNTKFKQELEKTWSLERRLETWAKNDKSFSRKETTPQQPTITYKKL
jgi:hypothetical protein